MFHSVWQRFTVGLWVDLVDVACWASTRQKTLSHHFIPQLPRLVEGVLHRYHICRARRQLLLLVASDSSAV